MLPTATEIGRKIENGGLFVIKNVKRSKTKKKHPVNARKDTVESDVHAVQLVQRLNAPLHVHVLVVQIHVTSPIANKGRQMRVMHVASKQKALLLNLN